MYDGWQFCILKMVLIATGVKQHPSEYYSSYFMSCCLLSVLIVKNFVAYVDCQRTNFNMWYVILVLSQKQRRRLCDRVSRLTSMSLSIKLQHSWLCLYQKLPGMPTIFVIYLAQHSSVCGFAAHRFDIFVSRFFNHGILCNVSAFIIHVHRKICGLCTNTYIFLGGRVEVVSETTFQILDIHCVFFCGLSCYWTCTFYTFKGWAVSREQFRNPLSTR